MCRLYNRTNAVGMFVATVRYQIRVTAFVNCSTVSTKNEKPLVGPVETHNSASIYDPSSRRGAL